MVATQDVEGADEVVKTILVVLTENINETVVMPHVGRNSLVDLTASKCAVLNG